MQKIMFVIIKYNIYLLILYLICKYNKVFIIRQYKILN